MSIKKLIRKLFWHYGYDLKKASSKKCIDTYKRNLFRKINIDLVIDVGANEGQYIQRLRKDIGYKGKVLSFEPTNAAFIKLEKNSSVDSSWHVANYAVGDTNKHVDINIAGNSASSSILEMLPSHTSSAPQSKYIGKENIQQCTLNYIIKQKFNDHKNIYLKIDTQGYEFNVLTGANEITPRISHIELEMSLIPLYKNETLFYQMNEFLYKLGFILVSLEPGFSNPSTGELLQIDGLYKRLS